MIGNLTTSAWELLSQFFATSPNFYVHVIQTHPVLHYILVYHIYIRIRTVFIYIYTLIYDDSIYFFYIYIRSTVADPHRLIVHSSTTCAQYAEPLLAGSLCVSEKTPGQVFIMSL